LQAIAAPLIFNRRFDYTISKKRAQADCKTAHVCALNILMMTSRFWQWLIRDQQLLGSLTFNKKTTS